MSLSSEELRVDFHLHRIAGRGADDGMPAYLIDDEAWDAIEEEAHRTWIQPKPETPIQASVRRARGDLRGEEITAAIEAFNRGARGEGDFDVADNGDGTFTVTRKAGS